MMKRRNLWEMNMADKAVVHIGENSPEKIAYSLLQDIMHIEGRTISPTSINGKTPVDRKWLLDTYAECIRAVTVPHARAS